MLRNITTLLKAKKYLRENQVFQGDPRYISSQKLSPFRRRILVQENPQ
jgi:hypothetical protein